jgi:hypothetical protein
MAVSNELTVQSREVIFEDMDKVTQEAATEGAKKLQLGQQVTLLIFYDLGTIVNRVFDAEHLNETQRKQELKKLALYWNQQNLGSSALYDLRNVAATFDREFVKAQFTERLANGNSLTWSHFKELQKVDEKRQLSILKQVRRHSWSANELALELQGNKAAEVKRTGGRKPTMPKTPNAMLQKLFTSIQQSDNYLQAVGEPLESIFMEMAPSDVNQQFVDNIDNTLGRLVETQAHIKETEKRLKKVRTRAVSVLKQADTGTTTKTTAAAKSAPETETEDDAPAVEKVRTPVPKKAKKKVSEVKTASRGKPRRTGKAAPVEVAEVETEAEEFMDDAE